LVGCPVVRFRYHGEAITRVGGSPGR